MVIYPLIEKIYPLTPLRKIGIGFFVTVIAFVLSTKIELLIMEGLPSEYCVAIPGLCRYYIRGSHGIDYLFGIFLYPGSRAR